MNPLSSVQRERYCCMKCMLSPDSKPRVASILPTRRTSSDSASLSYTAFMIIQFNNTEEIATNEGTIWDYPMPSEDLGISLQVLNGRGPGKGQYLNTICHEIYFLISGSASFHIAGQTYKVA